MNSISMMVLAIGTTLLTICIGTVVGIAVAKHMDSKREASEQH